MIKSWNRVKTEPLTTNRVFSTRKDVSVSPHTGQEHDFFVIDAPDWINVVTVTTDNELVLIEQYRHGVMGVTLEVAGGMVDPGESPLEAAKRELLEETGYSSDDWHFLGLVEPNPAIQSNRCHTFLARDAVKSAEPSFDGTEDITTVLHPASDFRSLVRDAKITHSLVICALYYYELHSIVNR